MSRIKNVIGKRFPELSVQLNKLADSRKHKEYSMAEIVTGAIFMFLFKETSRNAYTNDRRDEVFAKNYYRNFKLRLPHPDTIDDVMRVLSGSQLEELKTHLVSNLLGQKLLRKFRFLGEFYFVAVDATGTHTFDQKHCGHCLTRTSKNGVVTWFHYVLEAKIVTSSGLAISLATEFIENQPGTSYEKQDCEQKAFVRLAEKIKRHFPRLPICILADGLYPNNTVFNVCRKNGWKFIITLKDGSLKSFNTEVGLLQAMAQKRTVYQSDKSQNILLEYRFINDIDYDGRNYSWVSCVETKTSLKDKSKQITRFVYITNVKQTVDNVINTANGGRLRWKIENEGFNTQKNLGYELEHKYSRVSLPALKNYYLVLQIAHLINQLVENSTDIVELMGQHSKQTFKALWKDLTVFMKAIPYCKEQLMCFLSS